jgi:hypothetical protein
MGHTAHRPSTTAPHGDVAAPMSAIVHDQYGTDHRRDLPAGRGRPAITHLVEGSARGKTVVTL